MFQAFGLGNRGGLRRPRHHRNTSTEAARVFAHDGRCSEGQIWPNHYSRSESLCTKYSWYAVLHTGVESTWGGRIFHQRWYQHGDQRWRTSADDHVFYGTRWESQNFRAREGWAENQPGEARFIWQRKHLRIPQGERNLCSWPWPSWNGKTDFPNVFYRGKWVG